MTRDDRYEHGLRILHQIDGDAGQQVIGSLADVSLELGRQVIVWAFGDIYARPGMLACVGLRAAPPVHLRAWPPTRHVHNAPPFRCEYDVWFVPWALAWHLQARQRRRDQSAIEQRSRS